MAVGKGSLLLALVVAIAGLQLAWSDGVREADAVDTTLMAAHAAGAEADAEEAMLALTEAEQTAFELAAEADEEVDGMRFAGVDLDLEAELEADLEARVEAGLEVNAELEAEAEMEAEAEAAAGVGVTVRVQHRALNAAANARFAVQSRWFSWNKAGAAHTQLTDGALATLTQVDGADTVKRVFERTALLAGVAWNDMPGGSDAHPSDEPLETDTFHREYEYHGNHAALVHNVHFGCLQHFHSQCPSVQRPDLQNEFGDDRYVFSNADVRDLIVGQLRYWWLNAVDAQLQSGGPTQRSAPAPTPTAGGSATQPPRMPAPVTPSKDANFALGHILATVQDAWTKSHVLRSVEDVASAAAAELDGDRNGPAVDGCGRVQYFQGGDAQEGNTRKALETSEGAAVFHTCAQHYSFLVLKAFQRCATASVASPNSADDQTRWCTFESALKPLLEEAVYALAPEREQSPAGGSMAKYASPRIDRLGYNKVVYDVTGVGAVSVWEPTSTKRWHALGASDLQVSLCHTVRGKVRNFNGVTYRDEPFRDFQNVVRGGRQLDAVVCSVEARSLRATGPFWVAAPGGCEKRGWRLGSSCGSHRSCRPSKIGGCTGRCLCGTHGSCRCVKRLDPALQRCKNHGDIAEPV